jgi:tRNA threonylcarbamoyladenosine biosynthesis protein TsaE
MKIQKNLDILQFENLADKFGASIKNKNLVIGFTGELGSGKTAFIKVLGRTFGIKKIKSPSFIVLATYRMKHKSFYHLDLYRLNHIKQLEPLGLTELIQSKNRIIAIEWVEKFPSLKKICDVIVKISINKDQTRNVQIN